jgi:iron complex outermembrane receptor protein
MSSFSLRSTFVLPLCAALAAQAQNTGSAPHAAADHSHEPVVLENLVVTATPIARTQADLVQSTHVLSGTALDDARQPTIGETLAGLPGVSSTYFGPGASRPVLRGLSANRVRVLANSTDTLDASNTSPDHAVSVEPFLVKRIEVVRGPASLLYGSSAVGGVVNVIDHRIETELPARTVSGVLEGTVTDNGRGYASGGAVDVALVADRENNRGLVLHLDGFRREADDVKAPGRSGQEDAPRGRLVNSHVESRGGSVGLSYVSEVIDVGVNFNGFDTVYGIPPDHDELVDVDLRQRRIDTAATYKRAFGIFEEARLKVGVADYEHKELEDGEVGTVFENRGFDSRLELINSEVAGWSGAVGVQLGSTKTEASGDEAFLPTHRTEQGALFVFQERTVGATTWQVGARLEHQRVKAQRFETTDPGAGPAGDGVLPAQDRDRTTFGASFGFVHRLSEPYRLFGSLSYTERAPNGQELFAYGPHHGTHAYEIGNPDLDKERSHGLEIGVRRTQGFVTGSLTGFVNFFDGYIYERDTGITVDDENQEDPAGEFDRTFFSQTDAIFYGAEAEAVWHLHAENRHTLDLTTAVDFVRGIDTNGDDLPRIPALKGRLALDWRKDAWRAGTDLVLVAKQQNSTPEEGDTSGYALLGVTLGYCLETRHATYDFFVRGSNLTNEEARLHTSFLKDIAPLPGRAFTAGVRMSF